MLLLTLFNYNACFSLIVFQYVIKASEHSLLRLINSPNYDVIIMLTNHFICYADITNINGCKINSVPNCRSERFPKKRLGIETKLCDVRTQRWKVAFSI